jgi:hypothetical protein
MLRSGAMAGLTASRKRTQCATLCSVMDGQPSLGPRATSQRASWALGKRSLLRANCKTTGDRCQLVLGFHTKV